MAASGYDQVNPVDEDGIPQASRKGSPFETYLGTAPGFESGYALAANGDRFEFGMPQGVVLPAVAAFVDTNPQILLQAGVTSPVPITPVREIVLSLFSNAGGGVIEVNLVTDPLVRYVSGGSQRTPINTQATIANNSTAVQRRDAATVPIVATADHSESKYWPAVTMQNVLGNTLTIRLKDEMILPGSLLVYLTCASGALPNFYYGISYAEFATTQP